MYNEISTQQQVYETTARESVLSTLQGYNASIIAYGQTSAGKTYTMEGFDSEELRGIIPRAIEEIFNYNDILKVNNQIFNFVNINQLNKKADRAFASSVFPTPVGPTKRKEAIGLPDLVKAAFTVAIMSTRLSTANSCPKTLLLTLVLILTGFIGMEGSTINMGIPVSSQKYSITSVRPIMISSF